MAKFPQVDIGTWKAKSKQLRSEVYALYLASKHPKTPWYAKAFAVLIIGYVLSPIDFIPDFIPVIGYLDDFIIVFAGISLLIRMIPKEILEECREKACSQPVDQKRTNWAAAAIIVLIWLLAAYVILRLLW
jgi:uncharacterized membrane protein YkvA (DUF1232 family)